MVAQEPRRPYLKKLVEEGELPSVAQRVGPEPPVIAPVDGVRNYGGTWMRLGHQPE
jgi:hypothetical protein